LVETETLIVEARERGGRTIAGRTRNISATGAFVEIKEPVEVGAQLQLFIGSAHSSAALRTMAEVVRVTPGVGFGARFLDVDDDSRGYVDLFIKRFCKAKKG
jgi:hypothetical protein